MAENEEVKETARMAGSDWYENARREWNERYGGYIARARAWRLTAMAALVVAAIAVTGIGWIGAQSKLVPYIVQIDKEGVAVAVQPAEQANRRDGSGPNNESTPWSLDRRSPDCDAGC